MSTQHPLDIQRCEHCGTWWALRPYACAACGGTALSWQRATGEGVVIARSEVHRAPDAQWKALTPYTLVLVKLREQVTLMGHADATITVGQHVHGRAVEINSRLLLKFEARSPP